MLRNVLIAGSLVCVSTALTAAARGARDSGSAVAPLNATSHVLWGSRAARTEAVDARHTLVGFAINHAASMFWAGIYERLFGNAAARGRIGAALAGGAVVAALAYVTDYHIVGKQLTPGWEERVTPRSLAYIYSAIALTLPVRGLLAAAARRR